MYDWKLFLAAEGTLKVWVLKNEKNKFNSLPT